MQKGRRKQLPFQQGKPQSKNWSAGQCNVYIRYTKAFLNWACAERHIASNPLKDIKKLKGVAAKQRRAMTEEEVHQLMQVAEEPFKTLWSFLLLTGCRLNEALSLKWKEVNLLKGEISIRAENTKNSTARVIPLNKSLLQTLKEKYRCNPDTLVF